MKQPVTVNVQSQVNGQLMEHGAFAPLELLIAIGRLAYTDYECWRMGALEFLDQALLGSPTRIRALLASAIAYAEKIGLVAEHQEFTAWNTAGQMTTLKMSADEAMHKLLSLRFVAKQNTPQLDMFYNNPVVVLVNSVVDALVRRALNDAQHYLDRLYQQAPTHADLAVFDQLVEALRASDQAITNPQVELLALQRLNPLAKRLLSTRSRDFLVPLWRRLAKALEGFAFSSTTPNLHNSYILAQAQDFHGVSQSILSETSWWSQETLCVRLAECGYLRQVRSEALIAWCYLCWQFPNKVPELLDSGSWADTNITNLWYLFCGLEEQLALAEALPTEHFPAWLLLYEPGLCHSLVEDLPEITTASTQLYRVTHQLVVARQAGKSERELELRRQLQVLQPVLLSYLKSKL